MSPLVALELLVLFTFFLVVGAALLVYSSVFWSLFRDAPFVPSPRRVARTMMELAGVKPGETVVDLGSGHGEIIIAAAERGALAVGYELSPFLGFLTRLRRLIRRPEGHLTVHRHDFFGADLRRADVVTCYLFPKTMERLRAKFETELKPGTRVVSASFLIPGWTPRKTVRVSNRPIYLYEVR